MLKRWICFLLKPPDRARWPKLAARVCGHRRSVVSPRRPLLRCAAFVQRRTGLTEEECELSHNLICVRERRVGNRGLGMEIDGARYQRDGKKNARAAAPEVRSRSEIPFLSFHG